MVTLTLAQRKVLHKNSNVLKITSKQVVYTPTFKIKAVELYLKGEDPNDIFRRHDIDPLFFEEAYCRHALKRWVKKYEQEGRASLKEDMRGVKSTGRPPESNLESLSVADLKAIIVAQQELIEQIKKKKALVKKS